MSDANGMTTLVAIARFSKMMEKLYLYMALALGMVTVTVYGNGCIFYSQYMVTAHHRMSSYQVGQLALPVW